jgi:hypothetical protein
MFILKGINKYLCYRIDLFYLYRLQPPAEWLDGMNTRFETFIEISRTVSGGWDGCDFSKNGNLIHS